MVLGQRRDAAYGFRRPNHQWTGHRPSATVRAAPRQRESEVADLLALNAHNDHQRDGEDQSDCEQHGTHEALLAGLEPEVNAGDSHRE